MLARLREVVAQIRATASGLGQAATELLALPQSQQLAASEQSQSVTDVSSAVELLASAARDIEDSVAGVLDNAEQTRTTTEAMAAEIEALDTATRSIGALLEQIREIADRSDLLALNGSLEATRAGEAGRGFALVATEMRRLAERITGILVDVRERVDQVERAGASTIGATQASLALAEKTARAAREISTLTASQGRDTERASVGMITVAEQVISMVTSTTQARAAAEDLGRQARELEQLTRQFDVD